MQSKKLRLGKGFRVVMGNDQSQAAEMVLAPGQTEGGPDNRHPGSDQWLYVVSGSGVAIVNGKRLTLGAQSLVLVERGEAHEIRNTGSEPLRTVNIYVPPAYTAEGEKLPAKGK